MFPWTHVGQVMLHDVWGAGTHHGLLQVAASAENSCSEWVIGLPLNAGEWGAG